MSVRREAFRGTRSNGFVSSLKSALLWISILTGCFLFGWLVVSPLINVAAGRSSGTPPTNTNSASAMPAPQPQHEASAVQAPSSERRAERRASREDRPDIQLDADKNSERVQGADSVDRTTGSRNRRRSQRDATADNPPAATDTATESNPSTAESASGDPVNEDSSNSSEERRTTRRREPKTGQESSSQERGVRRPRSRGNDSQPADRGAGVQKSENVDN